MKQLALINPEHGSEDEGKEYSVREAARAIVIDNNNNIALLHVSKENYYKLPGGGVEKTENPQIALQRECLEEIGANVEVIREICSITEYIMISSLKQISLCYLAKIIGEKKTPNYTDEESQKGFEPVWLSYNETIQALEQSKSESFEAKSYITPRDITFLKAAEHYLKGSIVQ